MSPTLTKPKISIVVAVGKNKAGNWVIGKGNDLIWRISDDLKRFKALTTGHPIIMGRKNFESIGRVLPGRTNIVLTRNKDWTFDDVTVVHSIEEAFEKARAIEKEEIFVIGGTQVYEEALPNTDRLYITIIEAEESGDAFFPDFEKIFTKKTFEEKRKDPTLDLSYTWLTLERE